VAWMTGDIGSIENPTVGQIRLCGVERGRKALRLSRRWQAYSPTIEGR
jgi:hypothetical protein